MAASLAMHRDSEYDRCGDLIQYEDFEIHHQLDFDTIAKIIGEASFTGEDYDYYLFTVVSGHLTAYECNAQSPAFDPEYNSLIDGEDYELFREASLEFIRPLNEAIRAEIERLEEEKKQKEAVARKKRQEEERLRAAEKAAAQEIADRKKYEELKARFEG